MTTISFHHKHLLLQWFKRFDPINPPITSKEATQFTKDIVLLTSSGLLSVERAHEALCFTLKLKPSDELDPPYQSPHNLFKPILLDLNLL